jgi:adenine-specific DNA-methyltransferase
MIPRFPSTRYQGSKRRHLDWLHSIFSSLTFESALDAFGGTGAVSHLLSSMGKAVHYNDLLPANAMIARALFAPTPVTLTEPALEALFVKKDEGEYPDHISRCFDGIYFTDEENRQLDTLAVSIHRMNDAQQQADAWFCLFQACLSKRPYNLFHRANLSMRTANVERSFGNKKTWDRPLFEHMHKFLKELARFRLQPPGGTVQVTSGDGFELTADTELAYIDTPYARAENRQETNYFNFYHFLDCLLDYDGFSDKLHMAYAHRPYYSPSKPWHPCDCLEDAFSALFQRFPSARLAVSYRTDGAPSVEQLEALLKATGRSVQVFLQDARAYTLSTRRASREVLLLGN